MALTSYCIYNLLECLKYTYTDCFNIYIPSKPRY